MFSIQRGKGLALALLLTILTSFNALSQTHVFFDVQTVFTTQPPNNTNRVFRLQALSPFAGSFFYRTSDVAGQFYVSNCLATTYSGTMLAPPNSLTFSFYISSTNLGTIPAQGITSIPANGVATFPEGQTAYSAQASDARYAPSSSGPFGSLTAAQSTNLVQSATNGMTSIVYSNAALFAGTNLVFAISNALSGQVTSATNNFTSIVYSNANLFAGTNLVFVTSNALASQIGAAGISAVTATNIATNQVFLGTNAIRVASGLAAYAPTNQFDASGAGVTAATAATNGLGIASGLSAFVSTNRFDVSGAALGATNGLGLSSGLSAFVSTNRFDTNNSASTYSTIVSNSLAGQIASITNGLQTGKVNITNGISYGQQITNAVLAGSSTITLSNATASFFFSDFDNGGSDTVIGTHKGNEFFWGITNGASQNFIDFNIDGENEYVARGASTVGLAHRFYITKNGNADTNYLEITTAGIRAPIAIAPFIGNGSGLTNTWSTNLTGTALTQVTNIANSLAVVGSGITNAYGTNFPNGLVTGQKLYFPTNFDALGGSNFLYATKVASTNGFSTGQTATNLDTMGDIGFGASGLSTNIVSRTNFVAFINAGTSLTTNGALVWNTPMGVYTNWLNGSILTNNGSSWLYQTNGTTLYSVSGASPVGQYSAVNGDLPAPLSVYTAAINDHMVMLGYWSVSNQNQLLNSIVTNIAQSVANGFVTNKSGFGTNETWYQLGGTVAHSYFDAAANGNSNRVSGSGNGAAVLSGISNVVQLTGSAVIAGGGYNVINSGGLNFDGVFNGLSNSITTGLYSTILGGFENQIPTGQANVIAGGQTNVATGSFSAIGGGFQNLLQAEGGTIVGGESNSILSASSIASTILGGKSNSINNANYSVAAGRNVIVNSNSVFAFSDGQQYIPATNSFVGFAATNGFGINTNWAGTNALEVHGWVDSDVGFSILGVPVTAGGGGGVSSVNAALAGYTSSGAITSSGTITLTRSADVDNLGFGNTNIGFIKVTNTASIGGQVVMSSLILTNGFTNQALTATTLLEADANKKVASLANVAGILTNNASAFGYDPAPAFNAKNVTNLLHSSTVSVAGGGSVALTQNTDGSTNYAITVAGGSGIVLPPNAAGVLINDGVGNTNWLSTNTIINVASNNAVNSLPSQTNFWGVTNFTVGQAVVVSGTNASGVPLLKGTNWPTGGGSAFPLAADANANQFQITNASAFGLQTNASGPHLAFSIAPDFTQSLPTVKLSPMLDTTYAGFKANYLYVEGNGFGGSMQAVIVVTNSGVNSTITSNNITTGSGNFTAGSISVIPTNAAPVTSVLSASGISLPIGITNVFAGRAQPIVQYYVIDAVTGTPILTMSNETSGVKVRISNGALAFVETNFVVLPVTTTNSVWRLRDESAGSGASVGVLTNWLNGL